MTNIGAKKLWNGAIEKLSSLYPKGEASSIISILMEDAWGFSRTSILSDSIVEIDEAKWYSQLERLCRSEPVQYIVGFTLFDGLKIKVTSDVLIPRPETEELVKLIKKENKHVNQILDIGCGSGCIGIALARFYNAYITGIDVSTQALKVAVENAVNNQVFGEFHPCDILRETIGLKQFDLIVSNPPYIPWIERNTMHKNVVDFEPHLALFVPNEDPILFYRNIAKISSTILAKEGKIYVEVHESHAENVRNIFLNTGMNKVEIVKDILGKNRFVIGGN